MGVVNEPNERQILGAKIRFEEERYVKEHRKPLAGGWEVPSQKEIYAHLATVFEMAPHEVSRYLTYTRYCSHDWSTGACSQCPDPGIGNGARGKACQV